jgi:hypothetical protein
MNTGHISQTTPQFATVQWKESFLTSHRTNLLWYSRLYVKQWQVFKAHTVLYFIGHMYQTTLVSHHLQFLFASANVSFSLLRKTVLYCGILQNTDSVSFFLSCRKGIQTRLKEVKLLHLWIHYCRLARQFGTRWINFIKYLLFWVTARNLNAGLA